MAQPQPEEKITLDKVLKLVDQLSPEEQDQLVEQMKLQWLRRAVEEGEESYRKHGGIPAEEVFQRLEERNEQFRQRQKEPQ